MIEHLLVENDVRLARILYSRWAKSSDVENNDAEVALSLFDKLRRLELRSPNSARAEIVAVQNWLSRHQIIDDLQKDEIDRFISTLQPIETPNSAKRTEAEQLRLIKLAAETANDGEMYRFLAPRRSALTNDPAVDGEKTTKKENSAIIARLREVDISPIPVSDEAAVRKRPLHWIPAGCELIQVTDENWDDDELILYFMVSEQAIWYLDGSSSVIHSAHYSLGCLIDEEHVVDFLIFFCFFVHSREGPFFVLQEYNPKIMVGELDEDVENVLTECARPVFYKGINIGGDYVCETMICYGNTLFEALFSVSRVGAVIMIDDTPVATGLPIAVGARIYL